MADSPSTVTVSAPLGLTLLGDFTHVFASKSLVTATDQRVSVRLEPINQAGRVVLSISSPDLHATVTKYRIKLSDTAHPELQNLAETVQSMLSNFDLPFGFSLEVEMVPHSTPRAKLAAFTAAVIQAIAQASSFKVTKGIIYTTALEAVRKRMPAFPSGLIAAAVYGKTLVVDTLFPDPIELEGTPFQVLIWKAKEKTNMKKRLKSLETETDLIKLHADSLTSLVNLAMLAIHHHDEPELGRLVNRNQKQLQELGLIEDRQHTLCVEAMLAGAVGAKVSEDFPGHILAVYPESGSFNASQHPHIIRLTTHQKGVKQEQAK